MDIPTDTRLEAFVTFVNADSSNMLKIWAQLDTDIAYQIERALYSMESTLRGGLNRVLFENLNINTVYCALFNGDDKWYRAKIVNLLPAKGTVQVFFVDYGNLDEVLIDDLRHLDSSVASIQYQARAFILANVLPLGPTWSKAALKFCEDRIFNEEVRFHVVGHMQGIPLVNIFCDKAQASLSFQMELVREGHARLPAQNIAPALPPQMTDYTKVELCTEECELLVVHVDSPTQFWIQSKKMRSDYNWNTLVAMLNMQYRGLQPGTNTISHVAIGLPCIAMNDSKGCFARGQIESLDMKLGCNVFFVDYGNVEPKTPDCVFNIAQKYMGSPAMAYCATLALESNSIEVKRLIFSTNTPGNAIPIRGQILGTDCDGKYRLLVSLNQNQDSLSPQPCTHPLTYHKQSLKMGTTYKVSVGHVSPPSEFYVQLDQDKVLRELMYSEIQFMFNEVDAKIPLRVIESGMPCYVKSLGDNRYYRGEILCFLNNFVQVYFVDTGKIEMVTPMHIYEFTHDNRGGIPAQAVKCVLNGVTIKESQITMLDKELSLYDKNNFCIQVVGENQDTGAYIVNLDYFGDIQPISINERLSSLSKNVIIVLPNALEKVERLFITSFDSVHDFFGQLEKVSNEELEGLQVMLNKHYGPMTSGQALLRVSGDHVGAFCCAPYSADGQYYRGKILSKSANCVEVLFIDYGNRETMPLTAVKALMPEFAKIPQIGISCRLANHLGVTAPDDVIRNVLAGHSVSVEIFDQDDNQCYAVKILPPNNDHELTKKLISCGLIVPQLPPTLEYKSFNLEDEEVVFITYFLSPLHFWVQSVRSTPLLNEIMRKVKMHVLSTENHDNRINNLLEGMPCLAKYPEDQVWYRSRVKSVTLKNEIEVYFVDYGNSCSLHPHDLLTVPEHLLEIPCQAVECCFANIRPVDFAIPVLAALESKLLNRMFPVRVLDHEFPIKLEFTMDSDKAILVESGVFKTNRPVASPTASVPYMNGETENGNLDNSELDNSNLDNGCWDDTPSSHREVVSAIPVSPRGFNANFEAPSTNQTSSRSSNSHFEVPSINRGPSSVSNTWHHNRKEVHDFEDLASDSQRSTFRSRESRDYKGNPKDSTRRSRWDPPADEWVVEPRQERWSGSQVSDERRPGSRNAVPHRFIPPRMQRQMEQEAFDKGGSNYTSKTFYKSDTRSDNYSNNSAAFDSQKSGDQPKTELPPQSDVIGQFKQVTIAHVVSPAEVYCQLAEHKVALKDLLTKLGSRYGAMGAGESWLPEVAIGAVCCTQFSGDSAWYRAKVKGFSGQDAVVSFIDYGNEESVKVTHLKSLLPEFLSMPAQAVKCRLEGVKPVGHTWSSEAGELLMAATKNKTLLCQFFAKTDDAHEIKLIDLEQLNYASLNYDLLAQDQALPTNPRSALFKEIAAGHVQSPFAEPHVELGSAESVSVVWVNDPSQFFCQLEINASQLEDLEKRLRTTYLSDCNGDPELAFRAPPAPNTTCVALLSNMWYRAVVLMATDKDTAVYFVDYGNVETIGAQEIRVMKPEFMDLPAQAYKCNLKGIKLFGKYWPKMDVTKFQKYFEGGLVCTFNAKYSRGYEVDLMLNGKDVAQEMITDRLACAETMSIPPEVLMRPRSSLQELVDAPVFIPSSVDRLQSSFDCLEDVPIWKKFNVKFNERIEVIFSFVNSQDQFYLQNAEDETTVNALLEALSAECDNLAPGDIEGIDVGSLCVAQYSEDACWYRAAILRRVDEGFWVSFIDFGNEEVIQPDKIRKISPQFMEHPQYAAQCELQGFHVPAEGPTPDAIYTAFTGLIEDGNKRVIAEFKRQVGCKFVVSLYDGDKDLTSELFACLNIPQSDVSPMPSRFLNQNFKVGDSLEVYVTHTDSPYEFWVQLVSDQDGINNLQEEVQAHCTEVTEPHDDVAVGAPCLAQYSSDENWYRAMVLAITEEGIEVQFVDYGNRDVVQPDKVQRIGESFLKLPRFAIKCALKGLENVPQGVRDLQQEADAFYEASGSGATTLLANVLAVVGDALQIQLLSDGVDVKETLDSMSRKITSEAMVGDSELTEKEPEIACENVLPIIGFNEPEIPLDLKMEVYLPSIISPSFFWVQVDSRSVELTEMSARLDEAYKNSTVDESIEPIVGTSCVAQYSADNSWYRASISEVLSDGTVSVLFVDYGNVETVPSDKIRKLTEEFREVPVFAHRCRLTRVKVPDSGAWNEDVVETFKELLHYGEVVCLADFLRKENGTYVVRLLNMGLDVTESLVETGKVEASASPVQFEDEQSPETVCVNDLTDASAGNLETMKENDQTVHPGQPNSDDESQDEVKGSQDAEKDALECEKEEALSYILNTDDLPTIEDLVDDLSSPEGEQHVEDKGRVVDEYHDEVKGSQDAEKDALECEKEEALSYILNTDDLPTIEDLVDDLSSPEGEQHVEDEGRVADEYHDEDESRVEEESCVEEESRAEDGSRVEGELQFLEESHIQESSQAEAKSYVEEGSEFLEDSLIEEDSQAVETESPESCFEQDGKQKVESGEKDNEPIKFIDAIRDNQIEHSEPLDTQRNLTEDLEKTERKSDIISDTDVMTLEGECESTTTSQPVAEPGTATSCQLAQHLDSAEQDSGVGEIFEDSRCENEGQVAFQCSSDKLSQVEEFEKADRPFSPNSESDRMSPVEDNGSGTSGAVEEKPTGVLDSTDEESFKTGFNGGSPATDVSDPISEASNEAPRDECHQGATKDSENQSYVICSPSKISVGFGLVVDANTTSTSSSLNESENDSFLEIGEDAVVTMADPTTSPRQSSSNCDVRASTSSPKCDVWASPNSPEQSDSIKLESCSPIQEPATKIDVESTKSEYEGSISLIQLTQNVLQSQQTESREESAGSETEKNLDLGV